MISTIIETERRRLESLGYDTAVTPLTITVDTTLKVEHLGNDTYILTGVRVSPNDMMNERNQVCLVSPTECLQATERQLSSLGQSTFRLFRDYVIVKTFDERGWLSDTRTSPFRLDFVRISPIKRKKTT